MATVYSNARYIGGSEYRRYRASLTYSTSTSNTAVTITWSATVQMAQAYNYGVGITCEGKTGTGYLSSTSGTSYIDVKTISGTTTVSKGTSAKTKTITAKAYGTTVSGYGSAGGSISISANISIPALTSYTVTYNANGGSDAPAKQTKYYGKSLTITESEPVREGYDFLGWSTSSSATTATYSAGSSYTSNASTTLYAVWTKNSYIVSYSANGGTGAPASQTKVSGTTLTLSSTIPTRSGYTFLGWGTSASDTSVNYAAGASYTSNASAKLYAIWSANKATIVYNANGGTGAPASQTHTCGTTTTIATSKPTMNGYLFLGWSTISDAAAAEYFSGRSYYNDEIENGSTITMYAVWRKTNNLFVRVPDGSVVKAVYVKVPDGSTLSEIWFEC